MLAAFIGAPVLALAAAASLTVDYVDPQHFRDAGYERSWPNDKERAAVTRDITAHLQALADRWLSAGAALHIDVLDIDLAGDFEPFATRTGRDLRIVRDVTWPRLKLRYTLTAADGRVTTAEETVSDMNFLGSINRYASGDRLRYEKAMLDDWFERRFASR